MTTAVARGGRVSLHSMTLDTWLANAVADADRRGLPALGPLLDALARATAALRAADWNADAADQDSAPVSPHPDAR
ncbi:MAG: hypothetical protein AB7G23_11045 [Vicinamibacterales bacterium]